MEACGENLGNFILLSVILPSFTYESSLFHLPITFVLYFISADVGLLSFFCRYIASVFSHYLRAFISIIHKRINFI